jgi:hypothetical protein
MALKISLLLINEPLEQFSEGFMRLRYGKKLDLGGMQSLSHMLNPNRICFGSYKNASILTHEAIFNDFFNEEPSALFTDVIKTFDKNKILAIGYYENAGITCISFVEKGELRRLAVYGEEEGMMTDIGQNSEFEENVDPSELPEIYAKQFFDIDINSDSFLNTKMLVYDS